MNREVTEVAVNYLNSQAAGGEGAGEEAIVLRSPSFSSSSD